MQLQVSFNIATLSHSTIYQLVKYFLYIMHISENARKGLYDQPRTIRNKLIPFAWNA